MQQDLLQSTTELASAKSALETTRAANAEVEARLRSVETQRAELMRERHRRSSHYVEEERALREQLKEYFYVLHPRDSNQPLSAREAHEIAPRLPTVVRRMMSSLDYMNPDGTLNTLGLRALMEADAIARHLKVTPKS